MTSAMYKIWFQDKRKKHANGQKPVMPNGKAVIEVEEEEQHGDPTLVRTGKLAIL